MKLLNRLKIQMKIVENSKKLKLVTMNTIFYANTKTKFIIEVKKATTMYSLFIIFKAKPN